jgi:hypothetical protein
MPPTTVISSPLKFLVTALCIVGYESVSRNLRPSSSEKGSANFEKFFDAFLHRLDRQIFKANVIFANMASWKKPDPELLPIGRPRCPRCHVRMVTAAVQEGPEGFEHRVFECRKCGHNEHSVIASDPLKTNAVGWLTSELQPPK